jgi:tRNA pseudouridine13 synthase
MSDLTAALPHALGGPAGSGSIKLIPEDFVVEEVLGFAPSGDGEHVFLRIEKRHENTDYLARQLAKFAQVPVRNVGYAGLKDRHGRTIQWFSVQLPGQAGPDWTGFESDTVRVLEVSRNARKLRKGTARGNRFELTVRDLSAPPEPLAERLGAIAAHGVPNYFGPQRFGHDGQNLDRARELFADDPPKVTPHQRGLYLSAARSALFNQILAERVADNTWNTAIPGDVFMFPDSRSFFTPATITDELLQRVAAREIHPSGVLWGVAPSSATRSALAIENRAAGQFPDLARGLAAAGLDTSRRPFRVCPEAMRWEFPQPAMLTLSFTLPAGAYATAVLRELVHTEGFGA